MGARRAAHSAGQARLRQAHRQFAINVYLWLRAALMGAAPTYARAMRDGYCGLAAFHRDRAALQAGRRVRIGELARMLTWLPLKVSRREAALRPVSKAALTLRPPR